jgi:DUF4097 and DUF4098 domain-containing protein YvlB
MRHEFETPNPPRLSVRTPAGRIDVRTEDSQRTTVDVESRGDDDSVRVEQRGDEIVVEARKRLSLGRDREYRVRIQAPNTSQLDVVTGSADLQVDGRLGSLKTKTASGAVEVERVEGDVVVRSASGDVVVRAVTGDASVNTASGDVDLGSVGEEVAVRTASGEVRIGEVARDASVYTASGDQRLDAVVQGSVDLKSASGNVKVGIRRGSRIYVDARSMSGETTSELELGGTEPEGEGPLVELKAVTMSGDIRIVRA